jgi:hypothetical protein
VTRVPIRSAGGLLAAAAVLAVALTATGATAARAQTPSPTATMAPTGRISGTVTNGTAGGSVPSGLSVLVITLTGSSVSGSQEVPVVDGAYAVAVAPDPAVSYVLRLTYQDVPYFADAVQLSAAQPTADRDITIYEPTTTVPALTIQTTTVTLVAIDRAQGTLSLLREDLVRNPTDRVYVGADGGPTLRLPAPDGTSDATGFVAGDGTQLQGGVVTVTTPLLPGITSVVTRYTVDYDRATDRYRLRVTAPVQADRVEARAPARFIVSMDPVGDARRAPDAQVQGEQLLVVGRDGTAPGQGLLVDLVGRSGIRPASNPLTDRPGAAFAALLAIVVMAGGAVGSGAWRGRRAGP